VRVSQPSSLLSTDYVFEIYEVSIIAQTGAPWSGNVEAFFKRIAEESRDDLPLRRREPW
jgi:hypothetical protein